MLPSAVSWVTSNSSKQAATFPSVVQVGHPFTSLPPTLGCAAHRRAEQLAVEGARRAERHAERHARHWKANAGVGRWNWDFNSQNRPTPPSPPSEPVADQERMALL